MAHATHTPRTRHAHATRTPRARHAHTSHAHAMRTPHSHAVHLPQVRPATRLPGADVCGVGDARALLAVLLPDLLLPRLPAVLGLLRL
eukprot:scaffold99328_cov69-Phaeocystis_antarctica.AAC.2